MKFVNSDVPNSLFISTFKVEATRHPETSVIRTPSRRPIPERGMIRAYVCMNLCREDGGGGCK
jgi:hypothetical protein